MTLITLTTDFGLNDPYVATMKGVILSINPGVTIVDICHAIEPQNIAQAAFLLSTTYRYFPQGTIHVVVVDPGVGTERRALLLVTAQAFFIAPDNGVLTYIVEEASSEIEAFSLTNPRFWLSPLSDTFHGRDIFAPVAAYLSLGTPPHEFGEPVSSISTFPIPRPQTDEDGILIGHVLHIDRFGNLITDIKRDDLPKGRIFVEVCGHIIDDLSRSYEDGDELLAIIGSSERLEVSLKNSNAATFLRAKIGDEVKVGINKSSLRGR
ncbi:MAG: S-adenosyl-l-methionine hydroxide adenosyltransferase [Chloroflexi bacterium]|nr:MAG: S-adenosyl-l-methionine hydroxide adenosyltransferase [Chloroflexota bacterium]